MARLLANLVISAAVIAFATWLSKRHPDPAGFVAALPITTMLVLVLGHADGIEVAQQEGQAFSAATAAHCDRTPLALASGASVV